VFCDKAIELDPNYRWLWALRASALNSLKRYEEALASCDKAIELDPIHMAWALRASALNSLKRYEEALVFCDKAIELDLITDGLGHCEPQHLTASNVMRKL
jgi:tetratricopeptide (TPR) repeat protein